jgi:hypothetical protein
MSQAMVECVRCKTQLPASAADFSADGMLCKQCAMKADVAQKLGVASFTGSTEQAAEYAFAKSRAWKHLIAGLVGAVGGLILLVLCMTLLGGGVISPRGLLVSVALLVGGIVEIVNGVSRFAALNKPKP